jgi:hypothetical protein
MSGEGETGQQTTQLAPEIIQEATNLGWVPKEQWRGDPNHWKPANEFLEIGRITVPIMKENNKRLQAELRTAHGKIQELSDSFAQAQDAIQALQEFHAEDVARQVKKAKADLLTEVAAAKRDGDVELEVRLTDQLSELNAAIREAERAPVKPTKQEKKPATEPTPVDADFQEFVTLNPWFGTDLRMTNKAMGIAQLLRGDPENDKLTSKEFYNEVLKRMQGDTTHSRVNNPSPTGNTGGGTSGKTYADLPADAKAACQKQAQRLVGEKRAFKTMDAWQKEYARLFFQGE